MKTLILPSPPHFKNCILIVFSLFLMFSCGKEKINSAGESLRSDLLMKKDVVAQKKAYELLTENEQKEVWLDKIQQIITEDLKNNNIKPLLFNLQQAIKNTEAGTFNKKNKKLMGIGLEMAEVLPKNDFLGMFCTISDYSPSHVIESNCVDCAEDIKQSLLEDMNSTPKITLRKQLSDCNCKWTCDLFTIGSGWEVTTKCQETVDGCGWLNFQPCTRRVE